MHMPTFDYLEERQRLKNMTIDLQNAAEDDDEEYGDDEMSEGDEEEGELDFEGGEIIEEGDMEDGEEEMDLEDGEEEMDLEDGDEEDDEDEEDEEGSQEVVVKGKKLEQKPKDKKALAAKKKAEVEVNSSFYDDSDSSDEVRSDPRSTFLSASDIYDSQKNKRRQTREEIKLSKKDIRDDQKKLKLSSKIKERGRLTNNLKKKNNPFQMFIQKRRLQHRLDDLKKAERKTKGRIVQKGQRPRKLGRSFGGSKGK